MNADDPRDPAIDAAYRATARDEPPRELDERILAAAHRAVGARPAPAGRTFAQRWRVPVALAATVVLSATVTLMIYESEKSPPTLEMRRDESLREDRAAPASPAAKDAGKMEAGASEPTPSRDLGETRVRSKIEARQPGAAGDEEASRQSSPQRPSERMMSIERKSAPESAATSAPAPAAPSSAAPAPAPFPATPPRPAAAPPAPAEPLAKQRAAPGAASSPATESDRGPALLRERAFADRPGRTEREAATGAAQALFETPEEWIAEIRKLRQAGRTDEANRLLAEFRERFTDYPIPEDLR